MRAGRLTKRIRERVRERQTFQADRRPGWFIGMDRPDEYQAVPNAVAFGEFDDGEGGTIKVDLLRCCHCGRHFGIRKKGRRGHCMRCMQQTCGSIGCDPCNK